MKPPWHRGREPADDVEAPPPPRFVCRTCDAAGPFYVARESVNWAALGMPYRQPDGSLTYRVYNSYLPGEPGPPLAYLCGNCQSQAEALEDLVLEPGLLIHGVMQDDQ